MKQERNYRRYNEIWKKLHSSTLLSTSYHIRHLVPQLWSIHNNIKIKQSSEMNEIGRSWDIKRIIKQHNQTSSGFEIDANIIKWKKSISKIIASNFWQYLHLKSSIKIAHNATTQTCNTAVITTRQDCFNIFFFNSCKILNSKTIINF